VRPLRAGERLLAEAESLDPALAPAAAGAAASPRATP